MDSSDPIAPKVLINGQTTPTGGATSGASTTMGLRDFHEVAQSDRLTAIISEKLDRDDVVNEYRRTTLGGLYALTDYLSPSLRNGTALLDESIGLLNEAVDSVEERDPVGALDAIVRLRNILPELFCCRDLGDGFGEVIRAVSVATNQLRDVAPTKQQAVNLRWVLTQLRKAPFAKFDEVLDWVADIEKVGLPIDGSFISEIIPNFDD